MKFKLGDQVIPVRNGDYDTAQPRLIGEVGRVIQAHQVRGMVPYYTLEFDDHTIVHGIDEPCLKVFTVTRRFSAWSPQLQHIPKV